MRQPIVIYGAGGLGREVLSMLNAFEKYEPAGFLDDQLPAGTLVKGLKVLGGVDMLSGLGNSTHLILAIGDPGTKKKLMAIVQQHSHIQWATLVHPQAHLQDPASIIIGKGSIIQAGCMLTRDIMIGDHTLLNLNCTIGHDTKVGSFTSIMPGVNLAGNVSLGESVFLGSGVNIINQVSLGHGCRVGAGAVVIRDLPPHVLAVGVPAVVKPS